ncbi:transmembrane protein 62-like [Schistocerca americana]|uniref:transmembrane protein 62-like n=1 Tax=Schistocerca americana TaxID=7009 RepID=UPI001F4FE4A2|nr:transmembrane protein 62-like [Schistocerca americana]
MPVLRKALVAVVMVLIFSIFLSNLVSVITVDIDQVLENNKFSFKSRRLKDKERGGTDTDTVIIGNSSENLMWFLQVSDIHISIFHDETRVTEFKEFCDITVDAIRPSLVLASGDLTDAKSEDNMGSRQYVKEWMVYKNVLDETKINEKTVWLDIRGNHDNFNVPGIQSARNYYRNYSVQGPAHPKSYLYRLRHNGDTYSFIAMDACLDPGPRRPFNFIGVLSAEEISHVKGLAEEASATSDAVIWFGHYPTSCILAPSPGARALIGGPPQSVAYLCGHFHMLGGVVPNMYTIQNDGFLELELADWKDNRIYRLGVMDHGLFSFVDVVHRDWPVVLVTNPKHLLYTLPGREPLERIHTSTHIRILAFSLAPLEKVQVTLDKEIWQDCVHIEGPLFVANWSPDKFNSGIYEITVFVRDTEGREKVITQPFSLDGSRISFRLLPRIALMCNVSVVFQFLFGVSLVICIVPLCAVKILHVLVKARRMRKPTWNAWCLRIWVQKLWVLSTVDRIFYPLVIYPLYLTVGPWSVGEVIEGYTGVIFAWGIFINKSYLPGSFTYAYGFLQMCSFQLPLTLFLAHYLERRLYHKVANKSCTIMHTFLHHFPFAVIATLQMMFAYFFWLAYGTMAFLLGPLRTWSVILALILWCLAVKLPDNCLREAASVWNIRNIHSGVGEISAT